MWLDTEFQSWQASRFLTRIGYKVGRGNQFEQNGITVIFFLIFFFLHFLIIQQIRTHARKKSRWLINRGLTRLCRLVCTLMVESRYCHLQVSHCVTNHGDCVQILLHSDGWALLLHWRATSTTTRCSHHDSWSSRCPGDLPALPRQGRVCRRVGRATLLRRGQGQRISGQFVINVFLRLKGGMCAVLCVYTRMMVHACVCGWIFAWIYIAPPVVKYHIGL